MEKRGGQVHKQASKSKPHYFISLFLVAVLSIAALTSFALTWEEPSDAIWEVGPHLECTHYYNDEDKYVMKFTLIDGAETSSMYDFSEGASILNNPENVKILYLPEGLLNIGNYAMPGLTNLQQIKTTDRYGNVIGDGIPSTVTTIGSHAFERGKMCNLILPDSITTIESYAFKDCSNLDIRINQCTRLSVIGEGAFEGCNFVDNGLTLSDSLTEIGPKAYKDCGDIETLTIGSGVETIGDSAFEGCTNIDGGLTIPDSVKTVGARAFKGCTKLDTLSFGSNVETIGDSAFEGCTSIEGPDDGNLVIPESVTIIGDSAFEGCTNIGWFRFGDGDTLTIGNSAFKGCTKLKGYNPGSYPQGIVVLPESLTAIGASAFMDCTGIKYITLGVDNGNTRTIGESAFEGCTGITSISITKCVSEIGANAFKGCTGITGLTIRDDSTIPLTIGDSAFDGCPIAGTLTITKKVTFIGNSAFKDCTEIDEILFDESSQTPLTIDESAFQGCTGVTGTLTISGNLKEIRSNAFKGCTGVTGAVIDSKVGPLNLGSDIFADCTFTSLEIRGNVNSIGREAFKSFTSITSLTLGEGIVSIGESAFEGCNEILSTLTIPSSVTSIDTYAFKGCSKISTLNFGTPDVEGRTISIGTQAFYKTGINAVTFDVKRIYMVGESAFAELSFTGDLTLPKKTTLIGKEAFRGCTVTGVLTIEPDNFVGIGDSAFEGCKNFTALEMNDNIVSIGRGAFAGCTPENMLSLSDSLVTIGEYAFRGSLFNGALTIPDTVEDIGQYAFQGCTGLTSLVLGTSENVSLQNIGEYAFQGCTGLTGSLTIPDTVEDIGQYAFNGCTGLTSLMLGTSENVSLQSIGDYAFNGCTGFTGSLNIPDTVNYVGRYAFSNCSGFESLHISESITIIRPYTFNGCSNITGTLELPDMLTRVEGYAFHGCPGLTGILDLPTFTEYIGPYAFAGCGFTTLSIPSNITNISGAAFDGTDGLTEIVVGPGCRGVNANAFPSYQFYEEDGTTVIEYFTTGFAGYTFTKVPETSAPVHMIRGNHVESRSVTYTVGGGSEPAPTQNNVEVGGEFIIKPYSGTNGTLVFDGWFDGHVTYQPGSAYEMGDSDVVLQAIWVGIHKAIYNIDGGSGDTPAAEDVREGHTFELPGCTATKAGCEFGGWYCNGKVHEPGTLMRMGNTDMDLTAVWKEIHEVTYDIDGGSAPAPSGSSLLEGETFQLESYAGTKEGFEFDGWVYNGKVYRDGYMTMGKKDIILLAHWIDTHHVTYDLNGGSGEAPVQPDVAEGAGFDLPDDSAFTREGYHFVGWTYEGQLYQPGDSMTMGFRDMSISATWKLGNPVHQVTYDLNGGSGEAPIQGDVEEGNVFVVRPYEGSREGMEFKGWSCNGELYQEGSIVTMGDKDMVLTAVWAEVSNSRIDVVQMVGIIVVSLAAAFVPYMVLRRWYM